MCSLLFLHKFQHFYKKNFLSPKKFPKISIPSVPFHVLSFVYFVTVGNYTYRIVHEIQPPFSFFSIEARFFREIAQKEKSNMICRES